MDLLGNLRAFASVAEHGSLTRSAASIGVAPSALSRQIAALEGEARSRLFHRTGRGVALTQAGERLLPRAKSLLAESEALMSEVRAERSSPSGVVDVGVVPAARPLVAHLITALRREYPRIRLRAHEGFSGQVEAAVAAGRLDVGLFNRYGRAPVQGLEPLLRSPMVLIGRKGLPMVRSAEVPFRKLDAVPLALAMRPNARVAALEAAAQRARIALSFELESGSEAIIMDSVANAGLCTVVPKHVAVRDYGAARFAWSLLVEPRLPQSTYMAQTSSRPQTLAAQTVASLIRRLAPSLAVDAAGAQDAAREPMPRR